MKKSMIAIITALLLVMSLSPATALADTAKGSNLTIDTLTATLGAEPQSLDPAFAATVDSANYILHMLEGLTTIDRSGKVAPGIAESWTITDGGTVYTFSLRDAKWSDGQPVTADDFVYAWRRIIDPTTQSSTAYNMTFVKNAEKIANSELPVSDLGVEATDARTLKVTLEAPCGFFLQVVGNTAFMPARSDKISANPDDWTQNASTYPSDGPYMLQSWDHDKSQIVMVKNPGYWNASNITGPNNIVWKLMSDQNAIHAAYEANELQYASGVPANLYDSKDLREYSTLGTYYLDFNNAKAPFNDVRVRKAINLAIDRNDIVEMLGGNEPADNFVPNGITQPDDTDFNEEATPAYSTDPSEHEANVILAQTLLTDAGYSETNPFPEIVYITNDSPIHTQIANYIKQVLNDELGIDVVIEVMDVWNDFTAARSAGNFDIARNGWLADYGDPYSFLQLFRTGGSDNTAKYSNAAYDDLLDQANTDTNMTTRFQKLQDAQYQLMHEDNAVCPIFYYTQHAAAKPKLNNITYVNSGFTFFFWTVQGRIDTLTATIGPKPNSLDPVSVSDVVGANYILHMLEGLTTIDQSGKMVPGIAESWDITDGGTVYTFHLRDDAKWSDGRAVTADDFVYAWQRIANPANSSDYAYLMKFLKNGEAVVNGTLPVSDLGVEAAHDDDHTLKVTLETPYCSFLELTGSAALVPVPKHIVLIYGDWTNSAATFLANGPYKLDSRDDSQIVMVKNPYYWNAAYITGPGTIVWKLMSDQNAIHAAFEANELQYANGVPAGLYEGVDLKEHPTLGTNYLNFNCTKAPFNNADVRHAINLVIDRNHIKELMGINEPADNFVPKGFAQPDGTDFNEEATPPYSISPYDYESNIVQAKQLLASAGYPNGAGFPTIYYGTNNESSFHVDTANYIKEVLRDKLGINVVVQAMSWGEFQDARTRGEFDLARNGWVVDYNDVYNFLQIFKSDNSMNNNYYSNPAYDSLLDQSNAATDMTSRFQYMQQAQNLLMNQDYAICPIFHYTQWAAAKPNLSGIVNAYAGFTFFFWTVQIPESESLTEEGSNVEINNDLASTTITFDNVTESGSTYPSIIENPPVGTYFHLSDSAGYLDINSTAGFIGGATITVSYDPSEISGSESDLKLYQFKDGRPIDITQSVDTENNTITGVVTDHFCAFAVGIPSTYQVNYDKLDGSPVTNVSINNGALIDAPVTPTRKGYTWGWYKEPECKNAWNFTSDRMPERDITLYGKWTINSYTVNTAVNNASYGTVTGAGTFNYGSTAALHATPTTGYHFVRWLEGGSAVSTSADYSFAVEAGRTLTAEFAINSYTVNASANNASCGTVTGAGTYNHGASVTLTAAANAGYRFVRWTESGAPVSSNTSYTFTTTSNRSLTAEFTALNPLSISCTKTDASVYGGANGSVTISASGGDSGAFEYSIDGGASWQGSNIFSGLAATTYTAAVRDTVYTSNMATCSVAVGQPAYMGSVPANKMSSKANAGTALTLAPPAAPKGYTVISIKYSSTNPAVATVDASGNVTFLAGGKATIITTVTAQMTDSKGNVKTKTTTTKKAVTVNQPIKSISLNLADTAIARTQKVTLTASLAPVTASNKKLTWKSSNPKVATVSGSGVVTGKAGGTAIITCIAKDGSGASASCTVIVTPVYPSGVKLSKAALTIKTGKTASLKATIAPKNTDFKTVTWTSSNPGVAAVDAKGKVTAIAPGTAVITATASNGLTSSCTVTVN